MTSILPAIFATNRPGAARRSRVFHRQRQRARPGALEERRHRHWDGARQGSERLECGLNPGHPITLGGALFFTANDNAHGQELWKSDRTPDGTALFKDIRPGPEESFVQDLTIASGVLYFLAGDGVHQSSLWKSDGTPGGTTIVRAVPSTDFRRLLNASGRLFMTAQSTAGCNPDDCEPASQLWVSDGTKAGTKLIVANDEALGFRPSMAHLGKTLYFIGSGNRLWRSNGTAAGTVKVLPRIAARANLVAVGGILFWTTGTPTGMLLWTGDGTSPGTHLLKDGTSGWIVDPATFTRSGAYTYFAAGDFLGTNEDGEAIVDYELWRTDGTDIGTQEVANINASGGSSPSGLTDLGGTLFFSADDGTNGAELWTSDSTGAGGTAWSRTSIRIAVRLRRA